MENPQSCQSENPQTPEDQPTFRDPLVAQWQWQSDTEPWRQKDPTRRHWQDYSYEQCIIIENAFSSDQKLADLGEYEVDFKKMQQIKKSDRFRIRRVRRQEQSRFLLEIPEPTIVCQKSQKTINEAFGPVQHFLDYIMKKTPEAYGLYQRLVHLSLDSNENQFQDVIQEVALSIHKGAETREMIIKTRLHALTKDYIAEGNRIVAIIRENSKKFRDFLKIIVKIYTIESFICYWLNELLLSKNWEEINVLTPYLVCLIYTFKLQECTIKFDDGRGLMTSLIKSLVKQKMYIYRGAALTIEHFEQYNSMNIKYFSWKGVTSASRNKHTAEQFLQVSLNKAQQQNERKIGVMFKITVDFTTLENSEGIIDISKNCKFPKEEEVILAPGTL